MYVIAVLRSRTQIYSFLQVLQSYGVNASVVQTPRQAEVSCGLSVKMPFFALEKAREIISRRGYSSFVGFYKVTEGANGFNKVERI